MGRIICYYDGLFFEWSTVVDAPVTKGMKREEFEEYYLDSYGKSSYIDMTQRLSRAENNGTSSMIGHTLEELIECNRAGPQETRLTFDQIISQIKE